MKPSLKPAPWEGVTQVRDDNKLHIDSAPPGGQAPKRRSAIPGSFSFLVALQAAQVAQTDSVRIELCSI
jgi:hypothetical protein